MTFFYILNFLLLVTGIMLLLHLTPESITCDLMKLGNKRESLYSQTKAVIGKRKRNRLLDEIRYIKSALEITGKGSQFSFLIAVAFVLIIAGGVTAIAIGNPFLIPVLSFAFACIPFAYARRTVSLYDKQMKAELETALSIITTSYVRNDDIVTAVKENLDYLKPPVKSVFDAFVTESTVITSNIKGSINGLKMRIKNPIFMEWCDTLLACQDDRTLTDTLMPVVAKLTDVRIVNNELTAMMLEVKREYLTMVLLVLANLPILYLLNKDWYSTLVDTIPGKIVLAVCGITIVITSRLMIKYTQPVEYRR